MSDQLVTAAIVSYLWSVCQTKKNKINKDNIGLDSQTIVSESYRQLMPHTYDLEPN